MSFRIGRIDMLTCLSSIGNIAFRKSVAHGCVSLLGPRLSAVEFHSEESEQVFSAWRFLFLKIRE